MNIIIQKIGVGICMAICLVGCNAWAKELPIDVEAKVIPASLSKSELDSWLSQNQANFDFYVEGRTVAEYRKDAERRIMFARKDAQTRVARIDSRLKEQMTGNEARDKELQAAAEAKKKKVYTEELAMEEALFNRQLNRELNIMKRKNLPETRIAEVQREFREQLMALRRDDAQRVNARIAGIPEASPDVANENSGQTKIQIDRNQRVTVETKPYGGEMSDRAKQRLEGR